MKLTGKILNITAEILILAFVTFYITDKVYKLPFYKRYLGLSFVAFLVLWLVTSFVLKRHLFFPAAKANPGKLILAWSITSVIGSLINHWMLVRFYSGLASRPQFSIFALAVTWFAGLVLFLVWHYLLKLLNYVFSGSASPFLHTSAIVFSAVLACILVFIVIINFHVTRTYRGDILAPEAVAPGKTAVVFGAGVYAESGQPSGVLRDRIEMAVALFQAGKVESLLLSGAGMDGGLEVDAMQQLAIESGVPEQALFLDREGVRTYATCLRAYETFGIEDAVLVTQRFHLPRTLFLCDSVGLRSVGVSSDLRDYSPLSRLNWTVREALATTVAWWEVQFQK